MGTLRSNCTLLASAIVIATPCAVSASELATYSDRSSFADAVQPDALEDFNSFAFEAEFHTTPLDVGDFTLSMIGTPKTGDRERNTIDPPPAASSSFDIDGTTVANVFTTDDDSVFFVFQAPIWAFGADFGAWNNTNFRTIVVVDGDTIIPPVTPHAEVRFFGFSSTTPFTKVEFRGVANDGYSIDNVSYGFASLVVEIDAKHRSSANRLNPNKGRVKVALFGSETFDPAEVDPDTLGFGPASALPRKVRIRDLDSDGWDDLLVKFRVRDTGVEAGDTEVCLYGETFTGVPFEGCDFVTTIGRSF